jgi:ABC transport system ATP-binding/permease protein
VTLLLTNVAGLGFALLTSAMAKDSQAATDILPIWFMPQILFAGGIFPVSSMGSVGEAISYVTAARWSFEASGRATELQELLVASPSPIAEGLLLQYDTAFIGGLGQHWAFLAVFAVVPLVAAAIVLRQRTRT